MCEINKFIEEMLQKYIKSTGRCVKDMEPEIKSLKLKMQTEATSNHRRNKRLWRKYRMV